MQPHNEEAHEQRTHILPDSGHAFILCAHHGRAHRLPDFLSKPPQRENPHRHAGQRHDQRRGADRRLLAERRRLSGLAERQHPACAPVHPAAAEPAPGRRGSEQRHQEPVLLSLRRGLRQRRVSLLIWKGLSADPHGRDAAGHLFQQSLCRRHVRVYPPAARRISL